MSTLGQEILHSIKRLTSRPIQTLTAVAALALGIGASVAIFSVVNGVLLRAMPYPDSERLVRVWNVFAKSSPERINVSLPEFIEYREQGSAFESIAGFQTTFFVLCREKNPERIRGAIVSPNVFGTLGVRPLFGRDFRPEDEAGRGAKPAIVSYAFWQRQLGGDPNVLGKPIVLDCSEYTIVGVMPQHFDFPTGVEVWRPLVITRRMVNPSARGWRFLQLVARLKPGVTQDQAQAQMSIVADQLTTAKPDNYPADLGFDIAVVSLFDQTVGSMKLALTVLMAAVGLLLVIACANVGNLQLATMAERATEMAVRAALGASRWRLRRQLLIEHVLLGLCGGVVGLLLAAGGLGLLVAASPEGSIPRFQEVRIDPAVILFGLMLSLLAGIALGVLPALQVSGSDLGSCLRDGSRGTAAAARTRLRHALVVAEVALCLVLLVTSALLARSFLALTAVQPGFQTDRIVTAQLSLLPVERLLEPHQKAAFLSRVLEAVRALPMVESAGAVTSLPMLGNSVDWTVTIDGKPASPGELPPSAYLTTASPGYFPTLGIPVLRGRDIVDGDTSDRPPVALINERMAELYWKGLDPLGRRFKLGGPDSSRPWLTVVGLVGNVRQRGLDMPARAEVYVPLVQNPASPVTIAVRTSAEMEQMAASIRRSVLSIDPFHSVYNVRTMESHVSKTLASRRFSLLLLGVFAVVAVVLCTMGVYSVVTHSVTQRTREFGIRMAMGADRAHLLFMVLKHGAIMTAVGTALGLIGVIASSHLLADLLFGITPRDISTLVAGAGFVAVVALIATCVPAWWATRVSPLVCLRSE